MGYVDYHKVVEDFCKEGRILGRIPKSEIENIPNDYSKVHAWIEENNFPNGVGIGDGRGSGVGSLVCCCLGITNLDPIKYKLEDEVDDYIYKKELEKKDEEYIKHELFKKKTSKKNYFESVDQMKDMDVKFIMDKYKEKKQG